MEDHIPTLCCEILTQVVHLLPTRGVWAKQSGQLELWKELLEMKVVAQDLIPYVGHLGLANVPVEGWTIDPDAHGLLDGVCNVVFLPNHNGEVVHPGMMM